MKSDEFHRADATQAGPAHGHPLRTRVADTRHKRCTPSLTNVLFMALHARPHPGEALPELASARLAALPHFPGA